MVPPKGAYNVAVMFDRCRVTSCSCTCGAGAKWCTHVVALCLFRIHNVRPSQFILALSYAPFPPSLLHAWPQCEPLYLPFARLCPALAPKPLLRRSYFSLLFQASAVCLRAPVSESLSRLQRDQLQKFAQYLISELPQQVGEVATSSHCWLSSFVSAFSLGSALLDSHVRCSFPLSLFPQILPTAQRLLDELLSSQSTAINTVCGAPGECGEKASTEHRFLKGFLVVR